MNKPIVGIIMGSDSDLPIMQDAAMLLDKLAISYEIKIISGHRTPVETFNYAQTAQERGIKVIITGAGGSAHLGGMIASSTILPVIGVPIKAKSMEGLDSLLSIVQMPPGVPVATVAINGAKNAAILAAQILALSDSNLAVKLVRYKKELKNMVVEKQKKLEKEGFEKYLKNK